jgi:hypothetical protein
MQVQVKAAFYQCFGGINFMEADFNSLNFEPLITQHLGLRSHQAVYSYGDVLKHLLLMFAIGGDVLDDLHTLKAQLQDHPHLSICSPDTMEYVCNQLKTATLCQLTDKGVQHLINEHEGFNKLLAAISLTGAILNTKDAYTLDYDGHIVENTKGDNACNYKHTRSYYPVVCSINKLPVYMQNRRGNTPESYGHLCIIQQAISNCRALQLKVAKFRADACCYEQKTLAWLEKNNLVYYIRAEMNAGLRIALEDEREWMPAMLGYRQIEVCSITEPLFGKKEPCRRIVAYRYKVTGQVSLEDGSEGFRYYAIVTNDEHSDARHCIAFYNQRGCQGEHHFKELDRDFGWSKLPFDNMATNTVYMYMTVIAYLLFNVMKLRYAKRCSFVRAEMRLKNFILHFVTLTAKWIKTGRQHILKLFTYKDYSALWST